uniref:Uncharacterized protein n=1 Tax=Juglanconis oblonga TaxID=1940568 RepID=A0A291LJ12_9PEZI|nr:hypothetical protein [Juglanconis oblonga]ATI20412.1 hypothetical protein [Juglanconis oblonga]
MKMFFSAKIVLYQQLSTGYLKTPIDGKAGRGVVFLIRSVSAIWTLISLNCCSVHYQVGSLVVAFHNFINLFSHINFSSHGGCHFYILYYPRVAPALYITCYTPLSVTRSSRK